MDALDDLTLTVPVHAAVGYCGRELREPEPVLGRAVAHKGRVQERRALAHGELERVAVAEERAEERRAGFRRRVRRRGVERLEAAPARLGDGLLPVAQPRALAQVHVAQGLARRALLGLLRVVVEVALAQAAPDGLALVAVDDALQPALDGVAEFPRVRAARHGRQRVLHELGGALRHLGAVVAHAGAEGQHGRRVPLIPQLSRGCVLVPRLMRLARFATTGGISSHGHPKLGLGGQHGCSMAALLARSRSCVGDLELEV